jgi:glycosyltransferase involved in cell wall biosynthesis
MSLISIVLPTYNRGNKCVNTLKNLFKQTYQNFEIILINDGSNKNESLIIENFISSLNETDKIKIIYIYHKNIGTSKSINIGMDNVKGDFFTWISDDNKIAFNMLEELIKPNADFTYSNYSINRIRAIYNKHKDVKDLINNFKGMCAFLWKTTLMKKIGYFDTELSGLCDDYEYEIRTFLATDNIVHITKILMDFYEGPDTQSSKNFIKMKEAHLMIKNKYWKLIND